MVNEVTTFYTQNLFSPNFEKELFLFQCLVDDGKPFKWILAAVDLMAWKKQNLRSSRYATPRGILNSFSCRVTTDEIADSG